MKKCAYCNIDLTKKIKTKEHVIPKLYEIILI